MKAHAPSAVRPVRRFAEAARRLSVLAVFGALGIVTVAKSGLVIDRIAHDGGSSTATATAPAPSRAAPPSLAFLEPEAGPAQANESATTSAAAEDTLAVEVDNQGQPRQFSATELELLGMLDERRAELDEREQRLDLRAAMLETARAKLAEQLEELQTLQASIEARIDKHDAAEKAELARLAKIYERMKPKAAAAIFDRLDMGVLLDVVSRMTETKASAVIARMDPGRARQLTTELAAREELARLDR